jgi:signal transduction histidine kinase
METRQPLFETYRLEDMPEQARPQMADLRHTVTVPIVENDAVTGVVAVSRRTDRPFAAHEARLLELVTAAAGGALRNARLFQEAESGRRSLRIALEAAEDVAAATGLDDVIAKFLRSACAAAGAPYAALGHVEGEELVLDHSTHGLGVGLRWPMGAEVREAIALGRPAQVAAPRSRAPGPEHVSAILDAEWALTVPLVLEAELVGVISLGRPGPAFDAEEIDSVRRLAPVAALLLRNARLLEEARDASRSKSDFLNMAAHELRTPLAVIRGYLSMLGDGSLGPTPASWQPILGLLDDKSRDLGVIVDSLLTTARLQGGSLITVFTPVDLAAIVRDAVHRATTVAALTDGKIELSGANRPLRVRGDPEHLSRIADNLLGNALKYSSAPARVRVTVTSADGMAEIRVEDKGRGIRAADRERIFEQFVRVEDAENGYPPGTGLGLYIARQFTERHGGTLTVEWSEPGVGSRFLLRLPLV